MFNNKNHRTVSKVYDYGLYLINHTHNLGLAGADLVCCFGLHWSYINREVDIYLHVSLSIYLSTYL